MPLPLARFVLGIAWIKVKRASHYTTPPPLSVLVNVIPPIFKAFVCDSFTALTFCPRTHQRHQIAQEKCMDCQFLCFHYECHFQFIKRLLTQICQHPRTLNCFVHGATSFLLLASNLATTATGKRCNVKCLSSNRYCQLHGRGIEKPIQK